MYKLSSSPSLLRAAEAFRKRYENWTREVPFLLQRLGHQYKSGRKPPRPETLQETSSDLRSSNYSELNESSQNFKRWKKQTEQTIVESEKLLEQEKPAGTSDKTSILAENEKWNTKTSPKRRGAGEIMRIDISQLLKEGKSEITLKKKKAKKKGLGEKKTKSNEKKIPPSSFFVGGVDSDEEGSKKQTIISISSSPKVPKIRMKQRGTHDRRLTINYTLKQHRILK